MRTFAFCLPIQPFFLAQRKYVEKYVDLQQEQLSLQEQHRFHLQKCSVVLQKVAAVCRHSRLEGLCFFYCDFVFIVDRVPTIILFANI